MIPPHLNGERSTFAGSAFETDVAADQVDEIRCDTQTQTVTDVFPRVARAALLECFEHVVSCRSRYPDTAVFNLKGKRFAVGTQADLDVALMRELHRVVDQVGGDAFDNEWIDRRLDSWRMGLEFERQTFLLARLSNRPITLRR